MKKLIPIICAAGLMALPLTSCQKEDMMPEPNSMNSQSDEIMTRASILEQTPIAEPVFSVSPTKKVFFTKGNLYWDGNDWKFESSQTDYPKSWNPSHVGHFYWAKTAAEAYAKKHSDAGYSLKDKLFADGSDSDHMLTVEGQSGLYVMSIKEWIYLLSKAPEGRGEGDSYFKTNVTVNGVAKCLVIAPDGYSGKIASSYDAASWADAEASGLVCLPPANHREGSTITTLLYKKAMGEYLSSSLVGRDVTGHVVYTMLFNKNAVLTSFSNRTIGFSIRLVSTVPTPSGTAKATIKRKEVDVDWVQLWEGGPKFAVKNVGANAYTDKGSKMTFTEAARTGADYVWGGNWRTPEKKEMGLLDSSKVKCEFCRINGAYGFKFTGVQKGYTGSSLFFPADYGVYGHFRGSIGSASYWSSSTAQGFSNSWALNLIHMRGESSKSWDKAEQSDKLYVRPVLNE